MSLFSMHQFQTQHNVVLSPSILMYIYIILVYSLVLLIKGIVTAAITSIDPVNQEEVTSAPGFNTINSEGDSAQLISYGEL